MTTLADDIIRIMQERPDVREQVRRAVLTDELLELPQKFAVLTQRVDDLTQRVDDLTQQVAVLTQRMDDLTRRVDVLTQRMDDLTQRVDVLTQRMDDLTQRVDVLTQRVDDLTQQVVVLTQRVDDLTRRVDVLTQRMDDLTITVRDMAKVQAEHSILLAHHTDQLGILIGDRLERRIATVVPPRLNQMLGLRRTRVMYHPNLMPGSESEFISRVEDAADAGKIDDDAEQRIKQTDMIIRSRRKSDGAQVWIAVEASGTIGESDIERAPRSAAALKAVFDQDAKAVVVGHRIRDEDRTRAKAEGAIVLVVSESRD